MSKKSFNDELIEFLELSPTPFHAVTNVRKALEAAGFKELKETTEWKLKNRGKYFVIRNDSSIAAFHLSSRKGFREGFRMVGAHTDSPCLKLKPNPIRSKSGYQQLCVETYGGVLMNPWFDRDLSIAGKVTIRANNQFKNVLVDFKMPLAIIPSLAIHLDRDANNKRRVNPQTMLYPIIALGNDPAIDFDKILS